LHNGSYIIKPLLFTGWSNQPTNLREKRDEENVDKCNILSKSLNRFRNDNILFVGQNKYGYIKGRYPEGEVF